MHYGSVNLVPLQTSGFPTRPLWCRSGPRLGARGPLDYRFASTVQNGQSSSGRAFLACSPLRAGQERCDAPCHTRSAPAFLKMCNTGVGRLLSPQLLKRRDPPTVDAAAGFRRTRGRPAHRHRPHHLPSWRGSDPIERCRVLSRLNRRAARSRLRRYAKGAHRAALVPHGEAGASVRDDPPRLARRSHHAGGAQPAHNVGPDRYSPRGLKSARPACIRAIVDWSGS
jgi:hypothetical protein